MARYLDTETTGDVLVVRIERPPANAMSPDLLDEGTELVERLRADPPGAVVITGSGAFFSGGVDLKLVPALPQAEQRAMVPRINRIFLAWYGFARPVVAAVNGHAVAGGADTRSCRPVSTSWSRSSCAARPSRGCARPRPPTRWPPAGSPARRPARRAACSSGTARW